MIPRPHEDVESLFRPDPPQQEAAESEVPTIEEADLEESVPTQSEDTGHLEQPEDIEETEEAQETREPEETEEAAAAEPEETGEEPETEFAAAAELTEDFLETLIREQGKEKAMELLEAQKVTELRALARELKGLRISGRRISKANKRQLMEELRYYFNRPETEQ